MAEAIATNRVAQTNHTALWLRLAAGWHGLVALAAVAGLVWVWTNLPVETAVWYKLILSLIFGLLVVGSGLAAYDLQRRHHRGRVLSLTINYFGFLFCLIAVIHLSGGFIGINSLADTFGRGLPFLVLAFIGYLVSSYGATDDRAQHRGRQTAGKVISIIGLIGFLLAVGILTAVQTLLSRLLDPTILAFALLLIPFGLFAWAIWGRPVAEALHAKNSDNETLTGMLFLSPNLLGFLIFIAGPLLLSLYVSFTDWDAFGDANWVGLANYARALNLDIAPLADAAQRANEVLDIQVYDELTRFHLFGRSYVIGAEDKLFWTALGNTLRFVLYAVPLSVIPALFLANLLNSKLRGMRFFRAAYFLPSVAAVVGIALVWQWLYNATVGYINYAITLSVNALNSLGMGLVDPQIRWLSESNTALLAVVILYAWMWIGFNTVLFLAGLQNIPRVLYEAATVDGANSWQQFTRVTLPLLAPTTFFVVITSVINAWQIFEHVFIIMGQNPAGPGNSTLTLVLYLYQKGFQRFEQGYASALAWILFLVIFGATLIQVRRQRSSGSAYDM
jgi:ABC-type sugar transport system permease subunit